MLNLRGDFYPDVVAHNISIFLIMNTTFVNLVYSYLRGDFYLDQVDRNT